jgi:transcriptional regulator with XRE-family HTH domain
MLPEFSAAIKAARSRHKMSLRGLAMIVGLDHSYIGRLEKGGPTPSRETVQRLANALGIPVDNLLLLAGYSATSPLPEPLEPKTDTEITAQIIHNLGPDLTRQLCCLRNLSDEEKVSLTIFLEGLHARRQHTPGPP